MTRVAAIAVHGIGSQSRYQTLDKFARGLEDALGGHECVETRFDRTAFVAGRLHSYVSIEQRSADQAAPLLPHSGATAIDCYEAYWQPRTRGVMKVRGAATWLAVTMLAPVRLWAQIDVQHRSRLGRINRLVAEFLKLLVLPALALAGALGAVVAYFSLQVFNDDLKGASEFRDELGGFEDWARIGLLLLEVLLIFVAFNLLKGGVGLLARLYFGKRGIRKRLARRVGERIPDDRADGIANWLTGVRTIPNYERIRPTTSERIWAIASIVFLAIVIVGLATIWQIHGGLSLWWAYERQAVLFRAVVGLAVAWKAGSLFVNLVGDAALYLTDDPDSKGTAARREVTEAVSELARGLLDDGRYDRVHIVGHSLGSIISYDVLNELRLDAAAAGDSVEARRYANLGTFVSMACPLDQVAYFWSTKVPSDRSVRRQVLRFRHGLMQRPTDTDDGYLPGPERFRWLNLHVRFDPVGGILRGYKPDRQVKLPPAWPPWSAHEGMWKSRRVYEAMVPHL